ncbi:alpha-ketoglutarate-dependent taurine dioxygenase [Nonomuraea fuscirosea]|uniref:Alpha-ketoglutarate-dependent taurine dioxygenase n=1 Tax=Nonomuraea fuscirosea TaxID=1291556 RepID=A0A2T0MQE0_9ACTN|nr:TauD/TfdA family dioxygenase [Nonomuraea fuscirosea]PRX60351.1 alpha-ketoglutarate-dependent taurine dioxygenase [Nonomuraea fuscirosea]
MNGFPESEHTLPYVVQAADEGDPVAGLVAADRARLRALLTRHGALLLRGFSVGGSDGLERAVRELSGEPLPYTERSSPRSTIKGQIYTSTDYPPDQEIFLHNENSYQTSWPTVLYFHCVRPPATLGATPLADVRRVHAELDPAVREEFARRHWMYIRNFHEGFGTAWQYVFSTDDRLAVADYCRAHDVEFSWSDAGGLRTKAVRRAIHTHPVTGEPVWFNHVAMFHHTTLPPEVQEGLLALFAEEDLPSTACYGDGGRIPDEVMDHIRGCYRKATTRFDWHEDDLLVVENMLVAHGREPFTGPRRIAVAMAEPSSPDEQRGGDIR